MPFRPDALSPIGNGFGENCAQQLFTYNCHLDSIETITSDGYFPTDLLLKEGDLIFMGSVDAQMESFLYVVMITQPFPDSESGAYPGQVQSKVVINTSQGGGGVPADDSITTAMLQDDAVTTAKLADSAVTYAKLSSDITGITAGTSGAATATTSQAFNIPGVDATNKAIAFMTAGFSQPIVGTACTADTVTVHYAAAAAVTDTVEIIVIGQHNQ